MSKLSSLFWIRTIVRAIRTTISFKEDMPFKGNGKARLSFMMGCKTEEWQRELVPSPSSYGTKNKRTGGAVCSFASCTADLSLGCSNTNKCVHLCPYAPISVVQ